MRSNILLKLALKKIGLAIFSISMLISFGLTSNQAFAGDPTCEDCRIDLQDCLLFAGGSPSEEQQCRDNFQECLLFVFDDSCAVGGSMIQMETTSILAAGAQYTAAWMIPAIVSAIGIAIVIARKF